MEQENQPKTEPDSPAMVHELYRLVKERISNALTVFNCNPCEETIYGVMDEILFGYMFNMTCFVTAYPDLKHRGFMLKSSYCKERRGDAFMLYTDVSKAKESGEITLIVTYRYVIRKALSCKDIVGFYINPSQDGPRLLMTRQNMEAIVRTGDEQISGYDDGFRESLEKYPEPLPGGIIRFSGNK